MEIINKKGIDALISVRDAKNNDELRLCKENLSNVIIEFSKLQTELENILNTFVYLDKHKLSKVVMGVVYACQKIEHNKSYKNKCVVKTERYDNNDYAGISIEYIKHEDVRIKFSFFPFKDFTYLKVDTKNLVEFEIGIDYKNKKTVFKGTDTAIKIIYGNFENEIKMVIDDYKYLIKMLLNNLNKINNETVFE